MSDNQVERLNQAQAKGKQDEYDWLRHLLRERVDEWNANRGDRPEIVMKESSLEMDRYKLYLEFDPTWPNPGYVLVVKVGLGQKSVFGPEPPAVRHQFQPTASRDGRSISWEEKPHNVALLTTEELAEFAFDMLTSYYRKQKRK